MGEHRKRSGYVTTYHKIWHLLPYQKCLIPLMPCKNENVKGEKQTKYNFFQHCDIINVEKWKSPEFLKNGSLSADCSSGAGTKRLWTWGRIFISVSPFVQHVEHRHSKTVGVDVCEKISARGRPSV